jgi:four helix bundle protein
MQNLSALDPRFPRSFAHHGLKVYGVAFEAMVQSVGLSKQIPRGHRPMADQLKRAATAVVAAIAEGANRRTNAEKADKFAQARTEAGEAAAWCEMLAGLGLLDPDDLVPVVLLHERTVKMLSGLIRAHGGLP